MHTRLKIISFVVVISALASCMLDYKPGLYVIRNCAKDTLLLEITTSDTLDDRMYWGLHGEDTIRPAFPNDTIMVSVKGEEAVFSNYHYALPDSVSSYIYPLPAGRFYIYAIKWQDAIRYTREEIHAKKLYERRAVTKSDFHDNIYDFHPAHSSSSFQPNCFRHFARLIPSFS